LSGKELVLNSIKTNVSVKKLDIGCGKRKKEGFIGLDLLDFPGVDVHHDLNVFPYPFTDSEFDEIWADQVLEHLQDPLKAVEEIWRISKHSAIVHIGVPYFRSRYATIDPTHKNFFGVQWFDYFDPQKEFFKVYGYSSSTLQIVNIEFCREAKPIMSWIQRLFVRGANSHPYFYEAYLSHLIPLSSLTYTLKVLKEPL
jgi:SAM-dependent methyltransferase